MDRAHRLGQKRTVNVYRLLTRGTLEERIMGLQRFKLDVANAVVNADNASLASMDTAHILDLFSLQPDRDGSKRAGGQQQDQGALACPLFLQLEGLKRASLLRPTDFGHLVSACTCFEAPCSF
jgi:hypothetical protein